MPEGRAVRGDEEAIQRWKEEQRTVVFADWAGFYQPPQVLRAGIKRTGERIPSDY